MGFYRDRVFLSIMNRTMDTASARRIRAQVCAPLRGRVLEIGFGTGLNLPHLPDTVDELLAVEPIERGRAKAAARIEASSVRVSFVGLDGQRIPVGDNEVDAALSTWTLCSIPDPVAAVAELRRVLKPEGTFHFAEHGRAPEGDDKVRRWQDRLNGIQGRMACGCTLTSDIPRIIEDGGMVIDQLDTFYAPGEPKFVGSMFRGVARPAA